MTVPAGGDPRVVGVQAHFDARLRRLRADLERLQADAALISSRPNLAYLSDLWALSKIRHMGLVVFRDEGLVPRLLMPLIEAEYAELRSRAGTVVPYADWEAAGDLAPFLEALAAACAAGRVTRLAVEAGSLPQAMAGALREALPGVRAFPDVGTAMLARRAVKDAHEIAIFQRLGELAVVQFEALLEAVAPGVPEYELALAATTAGTRWAARHVEDELHSPINGGVQILTSGPYMSMPHKMASRRPLRRGDLIQPCFCNIDNLLGYSGSFGRVISVGAADPVQARIHEGILEARASGLRALRPGVRASEACAAITEALPRHNDACLLHRHGRGLGLGYAEVPDLAAHDHTVLAAGMVVSLEPALYAPGGWGQRIEDIVLITEEGNRVLTDYPARLEEKR